MTSTTNTLELYPDGGVQQRDCSNDSFFVKKLNLEASSIIFMFEEHDGRKAVNADSRMVPLGVCHL